ncbi:MAG: glycosyltransferase [Bacteroidia bacterium]|nr:glycosyltransferase [Bacteroidia bacterium]
MTIHTHLSYLDKNPFAPRQISEKPADNLGLVVVIPCHNEPDLNGSLQSLADCSPPDCGVEVIVVVNSGEMHPEGVKLQNLQSLAEGQKWAAESAPDWLKVHFLHFPDLSRKHAGVGLARKIGMDEAVDRLEQAENPKGIILCYDADCRCDPNYLQAVFSGFGQNPKGIACSIYFEHPTSGDLSPEIYEGIVKYELYLRYYIQGLRSTGYPHHHHTIGSSMAVRADVYAKEGGMNRRKAGEDFYFLHKLMPLGNFFEVNDTRVIPSPRTSDRVPFGTGKAMSDWLQAEQKDYPVYAVESFRVLKSFLEKVYRELFDLGSEDYASFLQELPQSMREYLEMEDFISHVEEAKWHSTSPQTFFKRFFQWFNGLETLQFFHFARDNYYANQPVAEAARELLGELGENGGESELDLLTRFRELDRG